MNNNLNMQMVDIMLGGIGDKITQTLRNEKNEKKILNTSTQKVTKLLNK